MKEQLMVSVGILTVGPGFPGGPTGPLGPGGPCLLGKTKRLKHSIPFERTAQAHAVALHGNSLMHKFIFECKA